MTLDQCFAMYVDDDYLTNPKTNRNLIKISRLKIMSRWDGQKMADRLPDYFKSNEWLLKCGPTQDRLESEEIERKAARLLKALRGRSRLKKED